MIHAVVLGAGKLEKGLLKNLPVQPSNWQMTCLDNDAEKIRQIKETNRYGISVIQQGKVTAYEFQDVEAYLTLLQPQDCYAMVYADVLFICLMSKDQAAELAYLKKVLSMRAKTNPAQRLTLYYLSHEKEKTFSLMQAITAGMKEEEWLWFTHQTVFHTVMMQSKIDE